MLFKTTDDSEASCIHDCLNYRIAMQAHLLHFGLISVKIESVEPLEGNIEPCFEPACLEYIEQLEHEEFK
jgi:hypothetical protein